MTDPAPAPAQAPIPVTYESRLPSWQQGINRFCENWIFAFIVAMAIRHCALEAFRIPSASMEPMLYGDPAFMKGDYVVVDKLFCRFTGVKRWDVTVFQFPLPEVEAAGNDARPAIDANDERLDRFMVRPLMYRNFVKRAVILPGDNFFIRCGNIYLKQNGAWVAARKPDAIQEALWMDIYHHGAQENYLPWTATGKSAVKAQGADLEFSLVDGVDGVDGADGADGADGKVSFSQPLRNLYLKPGQVKVRPFRPGDEDPLSPEFGEPSELVEAAMLKPVFHHRATGREGNIWDLENWTVNRMNSADLDNNSYGTRLNDKMNEWVDDLRLLGTVTAMTGEVVITIAQGKVHAYRLVLTLGGWRCEGDGKPLGQGSETPLGAMGFAHIDDQVVVTMGGKEVLRREVPALEDPQRLSLELSGSGKLALREARLQRDLHYSSSGFLRDAKLLTAELDRQVTRLRDSMSNPIVVDQKTQALRLLTQVRAHLLGKSEDQMTTRERSAPVGTCPDNAITAPAGAYLLLGDNSPHSWDGREWGWVPVENVRGRALAVVMPPGRMRLVR